MEGAVVKTREIEVFSRAVFEILKKKKGRGREERAMLSIMTKMSLARSNTWD
jgi:hypothetical protein